MREENYIYIYEARSAVMRELQFVNAFLLDGVDLIEKWGKFTKDVRNTLFSTQLLLGEYDYRNDGTFESFNQNVDQSYLMR